LCIDLDDPALADALLTALPAASPAHWERAMRLAFPARPAPAPTLAPAPSPPTLCTSMGSHRLTRMRCVQWMSASLGPQETLGVLSRAASSVCTTILPGLLAGPLPARMQDAVSAAPLAMPPEPAELVVLLQGSRTAATQHALAHELLARCATHTWAQFPVALPTPV